MTEPDATAAATTLPMVKEIMSSPPICVTLGHTVHQVLLLTQQRRVSGFPIIDMEGKAVGVISTLDLITEEAIGKSHLKLGELPLAIKVEKDVFSLHEDTPVKEALLLFIKTHIGRIIVTDNQGKVSGIISRMDVVNFLLDRHLAQGMRSFPAHQ